jgi:Cof subfamily protein (haloacid dehalogenase superfamily)
MLMTRPDALFLDIDGTILKSDHSLSPRVAGAVSALLDDGVLVCLATGRSWESLKPLYDKLGLVGPTICYNGAMIVEGPEGLVVYEKDVDEDAGRAAIREARSHKLGMVAYRHSELVYEWIGPEVEAYFKRVGLTARKLDFDTLETLEFTKAIIMSDPSRLEPVKDSLERRFTGDRLSATYSDPRFLELMGGGIDKGRGLLEVCRENGISPSKTTAMGDGWNDLALLEAAGDAWVMGGAPDELKARFPRDRVALDSDMDGAAVVMEAMLNREAVN